MNIPRWAQEVLTDFENRADAHSEVEIADAFHAARRGQGDQNDSDWKGYIAEWSAFLFRERRKRDSVWNTYFAPMSSGKNDDGTDFFAPDIKNLDGEAVAYWEGQAKCCRNSVMRARYADLVWDLKRAITGQKPDVDYARIAIDSYVESVDKNRYSMDIIGIQKLSRALDLSVSINDPDRTKRAVDLMFELYGRIAKPQFMGTWVFLFDNLYGKPFISQGQESRIVASLEAMLAKVSDVTATEAGVHLTLDPWGAEAAATRLAEHYLRIKDQDNRKRVVKLYGAAFEHLAKEANPMIAMAWLQPVVERYEQEGLKQDAEHLRLLSEEKGKHIDSNLKRIGVNIEATQEDVDKLVENLLGSGDLKTSLGRVAAYFIPKVSDARELLEKLKTDAPLLSRIPISIIGKDGHISGRIESIDDDPDGQLHHQLSQIISFYQPFLTHALTRLRDRYEPTVEQILEFLCISPLFGDGQSDLLRDGLVAYVQEDFIKAIHVLVPQIEHILRAFLGSLGIPIIKSVRNRPGLEDAKSMNDVLGDERMRQILTEDLWRYLAVFYVDKRGFNLRNDLAHGLVARGGLNRLIADRVFHTLLALSLMRPRQKNPGE